MLRQSNMSGIYNALAANAPPATFGAAVIASPWASSHYGYNLARFTGGPPNIIAATGGGTIQADGSTGSGGCSTKGGGINLGVGPISAGTVFNACQVKAITGGLLVGMGGFVLLVGAALIASHGLKGTQLAAGIGKVAGGPVGIAAGIVTSGAERARPTNRRLAAAEREQPTESYASRQRRYRSEGFESTDLPQPSGGRRARAGQGAA
jgi:hypothetical protein